VLYGLKIVAILAMLVPCIMLESSMSPNPVMKLGLIVSGVAAGDSAEIHPGKKVAKRQTLSASRCPMRWT